MSGDPRKWPEPYRTEWLERVAIMIEQGDVGLAEAERLAAELVRGSACTP